MTDRVAAGPGDSASAEDFLAHHDDPRPAPLLEEGRVIDGWRVAAFLGRGGSGEVYRVEGAARAGALKVLVRDTETSRARFRRETSLLSQMDSPGFPRFYGRGDVDGRPYLVMELLEPRALPKSDAGVAEFLLKLCDGVSALHRMGYIHRDIKPGNILWRVAQSRGGTPASAHPVLIDLGLAKDATRDFDAMGTSLTLIDGHAAGVGTPGYAAPEQLIGDEISPASDIHSLGILANACFGGSPPPAWGRIVDRATGSIPARRYPDVAAFARAIRRRHWRRWLLVVAVSLAAAGAGVAWMAWGVLRDTPHDAEPTGRSDAMARPDESEESRWAALCTDVVTNRITRHALGWTTYTNEMYGVKGRYVVTPLLLSTRPMTNVVRATIVNLGGRTNVFTRPIRLDSGREYWIVGPGVLDAAVVGRSNNAYHEARRRFMQKSLGFTNRVDASTGRVYAIRNDICAASDELDRFGNGPTNGVVHLVRCTFKNRADTFWPKNGLYYCLEGGAGLHFPQMREDPEFSRSSYAAPFDTKQNEIRFWTEPTF